MRLQEILFTIFISLLVVNCGDMFEDETKALLKKPELISMIMNPPEAAPGEQVTASFLFADEKGIIDDSTNIWLPGSFENEDSQDEIFAELAKLGLNIEHLFDNQITFTLKSESDYTFDEDGFASESLFLIIPKESEETSLELDSITELMQPQKAVKGIRTVVVSQRVEKVTNPEVDKITYRENEEGEESELNFISSNDEDISTKRQKAADNPLILTELQDFNFICHLKNKEKEETTTYQWISTSGDFHERREREQPYTSAEFQSLKDGETDFTDMEKANHRLDPNLHPIWLILRDSENNTSQTWVEFYVRIVQ